MRVSVLRLSGPSSRSLVGNHVKVVLRPQLTPSNPESTLPDLIGCMIWTSVFRIQTQYLDDTCCTGKEGKRLRVKEWDISPDFGGADRESRLYPCWHSICVPSRPSYICVTPPWSPTPLVLPPTHWVPDFLLLTVGSLHSCPILHFLTPVLRWSSPDHSSSFRRWPLRRHLRGSFSTGFSWVLYTVPLTGSCPAIGPSSFRLGSRFRVTYRPSWHWGGQFLQSFISTKPISSILQRFT